MEGEAVPIDVGKANEHWFLNAASIGFGAEFTANTPPELKSLLGQAAYTVMGAILAINVRHYQGRLTLPDREITGAGPMAIVCNGRQTGGGFDVAPRARIDDGLLDILAVRDIPAMALLRPEQELQELSPDGEYISYWQTPWAETYTEEAIPVNLDGEPVQFSSVRYEAVQRGRFGSLSRQIVRYYRRNPEGICRRRSARPRGSCGRDRPQRGRSRTR